MSLVIAFWVTEKRGRKRERERESRDGFNRPLENESLFHRSGREVRSSTLSWLSVRLSRIVLIKLRYKIAQSLIKAVACYRAKCFFFSPGKGRGVAALCAAFRFKVLRQTGKSRAHGGCPAGVNFARSFVRVATTFTEMRRTDKKCISLAT